MNPTLTIHKGFDLVIAKVFLPVGVPVNIEPILQNVFTASPNFGFIWLVVQGSVEYKNVDTGETINWSKFDSTLSKPFTTGEWQATILEDIECLCINQHMNLNKFPIKDYVEVFTLEKNNNCELLQGTQLFLGSGELQIDNKVFVGPRQIKITTENKTAQALTDAVGYIVK